jgi:hypothetical protein
LKLLKDLNVLLKELIARTERRSAYWRKHAEQHRPAGEGDISTWLRRNLTVIIDTHSDKPERYRRRWVADTAKAIGAKYPNETKNKRRFLGQQPPKPKPSHAIETGRRRRPDDKKARALARRLRGVKI